MVVFDSRNEIPFMRPQALAEDHSSEWLVPIEEISTLQAGSRSYTVGNKVGTSDFRIKRFSAWIELPYTEAARNPLPTPDEPKKCHDVSFKLYADYGNNGQTRIHNTVRKSVCLVYDTENRGYRLEK